MLVVDASAILDLLLARSTAGSIAEILREHDLDLHAPTLIDVEVVSALRRLERGGHLDVARAGEAFEDLRDLPIERHPLGPLLVGVWHWRHNVSAYDGTYLVLAGALRDAGVPLLTTDARFATAARAHTTLTVLTP